MVVRRKSTANTRQCRIGISGWTYAPWRKVFFPEKLPHRRELEFASRQVTSIEINGTFYSLQKPGGYQKWREETPHDFIFSLKGGRFITRIKRLREVEAALANYFASGPLALQEKLGPILWQMPPSFKYDAELLEGFFNQLPRDTAGALALGRKHSAKVDGRIYLEVHESRPIRHALEIRHPSFENEEFIALLRKHDIAIVVADIAGKWPLIEDITSDFMYLRLHGDEELYASGYSEEALNRWASKIKSWIKGKNSRGARTLASKQSQLHEGLDVFVYFDNDIKVHAPFDVIPLSARLGMKSPATWTEGDRLKNVCHSISNRLIKD